MADKTSVIKETQKYLAKGQIDKAISEWENFASEVPDGNVYNTIGDLYIRKGDKKSALTFFHKAADFLKAGGFALKSIALYKKIINIDPSDADAHIALGELSEEKALASDAIKYYLAAADFLSGETDKKKFLSIYRKILSLAPFNISLRAKAAEVFLKEGLASDAVKEYIYIARFSMDRKDHGTARDCFMRALDIQPDSKDALLGLSSLLENEGDIRQAIAYQKKAISKLPEDAALLLHHASLLIEIEAYDEAISYLSKLLEINPSEAEACRLMGDIYLKRKDRIGAWENYKAVVYSFAKENRINEAIALAVQFRDVDPAGTGKILISLYRQAGNTEAAFEELVSVAGLLSESGNREEAIDCYMKALEIHPDSMHVREKLAEQETISETAPSASEGERPSDALLAKADIFIKYGLNDKARQILEELKIKDPMNADIHARLKSIYLEISEKELAVTECLILAEIHKRNSEPVEREAALKEAFIINRDDPRLSERMSELSEIKKSAADKAAPPDPDAYAEDIARADFLARQGLAQEALSAYQKLLSIFPDNENFRGKISSLTEHMSGGQPAEEEPAFPSMETIETQEIIEPQIDSDILDIFTEFKDGLEKELGADDYETHYDLGIAYKEMGLVDDAIKEFQVAKKDPRHYVRAMNMLGICYMEKDLFQLAVEAFKATIDKIDASDEASYTGVKYDLALAYEKSSEFRKAMEIYSEIYSRDAAFREVSSKIDYLKALLSKSESAAKPEERKAH